jgi:hypothetical protein
MAVNHFRIGEAYFLAKISSQVKHLKECIMMYLNYTRRLSKLLKTRYPTGELEKAELAIRM